MKLIESPLKERGVPSFFGSHDQLERVVQRLAELASQRSADAAPRVREICQLGGAP